jgi:hypothetical protein
MFKKNHFVILSGKSKTVHELLAMAKDFADSGSALYTSYRELNENTLILAYPKSQSPRLEDLRKLLIQYDDVVVSTFDSDEVVVMNQGSTESIHP